MRDRQVKGAFLASAEAVGCARSDTSNLVKRASTPFIVPCLLLDHRVQGWRRVVVVTIVGVVSSGVPAFWSASIAFADLVIWMSGLKLPGGAVPRSRAGPGGGREGRPSQAPKSRMPLPKYHTSTSIHHYKFV
jgi:hypothetical protein